MTCASDDTTAAQSFRFLSSPDFLNSDIDYPAPGWDTTLDYVLKCWEAENTDFVLVAGDMVWGRWADQQRIEELSGRYYQAWIRRMREHKLKYFVALGDHEIGDDPWPPQKVKLVPFFKKVFAEHFQMPTNGPEHLKRTAYYFRHHNCLFICVDLFEIHPAQSKNEMTVDTIQIGVTGKQLEWLEAVLKNNRDVNHTIVMGHAPVLGPIPPGGPSSRLMVQDGRQSSFWKVMAKYGVDLYLAGEHHVIDCRQADGIVQITHGTALGFFESTNYLMATVEPDSIFLVIKELPVEVMAEGDDSWDRIKKSGVPHRKLNVSRESRKSGFKTVGTMLIDKHGGQRMLKNRKGCFENIQGRLIPHPRGPRT